MHFVRTLNHGSLAPRDYTIDQLRRFIIKQGLRPGDALPNYDLLAKHFKVSRMTIHRAMAHLAKDGMITRMHRKGCFVAKRISPKSPALSEIGVISAFSRKGLFFSYLREIMVGIMSACEPTGMDLNILSVFDAPTAIHPQDLSTTIDGVLLLGVLNDNYIAAMAKQRIPTVVLDYHTEAAALDYVVCDNAGATRAVMEHLLALGHRRIVYLGGMGLDIMDSSRHQTHEAIGNRERREAYLDTMISHGLGNLAHAYVINRSTPELREQTLKEALAPFLKKSKAAESPTALLVYDAKDAYQFYAMAQAAGLQAPRDFSIAAVASSSDEAHILGDRPLTCTQCDFHNMGVQGVQILQRRCRGALPKTPSITRVGFNFHPGATAASLTPSSRAS